MSWIYLPKTLHQFRQEKHNVSIFEKRLISRKQRRREYWSLFYTLWLFVFLIFAVRIGTITLAVVGAKYSKGLRVILPEIDDADYITNLDDRIDIYIDRFKYTVINNKTMKNWQNLYDILNNLYYKNPNGIPVIIADKDCEAKYIELIIMSLRYTGFQKVIFKTYSNRLL